ncbi:NADH-cytochrome b5 reductase-like isoform X2 [Babylonia areolata]|uniref:NADH-cytochrome b5 reductase-like isoform X2 n=1 Tax=Babylonia areolata TaxID=304850 RepID=UPI003FD12BDA
MEQLPEKPEKPLDSDCCGNGCVPCVLDIYAEELAIWERECARIQSGKNLEIPESTGTHDEYVSPELSSTVYHQYQIKSITQETWDSWRFTCQLGCHQCLGLLPGQHVVIRGCSEGKSITRQYTPISEVALKGSFELLIKIVKQWQEGDWLDIRGPFGTLQYTPNEYSRVLMLAAGTGIAPMAQLIQTILSNEAEEGRIRLLYACKTYQDVLMKREIQEWRQFWNFSAVYVLSQEPPVGMASTSHYQYGEEIVPGKINKTQIENELGEQFHGTRVLICGTRSFDADMLKILEECGFPKEHVFRF